ncbi:hypothetical protein LSUE1_G002586 [Lachnellula suecica]|uniref:Apple domain-containing protein n=1 Tax=Lachnellula suecica TaxID=602035 RepID=A0A8T9CD84_9HELO|nr:hypothetical protein LSUE1_G002586 [Lachnellula suecica]
MFHSAMNLKNFIWTISLALGSTVTASPWKLPASTATSVTPPPPVQTYETGFPLCAIPGFTEVPGNYTEIVEQDGNSTLKCCRDQCRAAYPACKSIAFHKRYAECLFFNQVVERTQLERDNSSEFVHYDLKCHVR